MNLKLSDLTCPACEQTGYFSIRGPVGKSDVQWFGCENCGSSFTELPIKPANVSA